MTYKSHAMSKVVLMCVLVIGTNAMDAPVPDSPETPLAKLNHNLRQIAQDEGRVSGAKQEISAHKMSLFTQHLNGVVKKTLGIVNYSSKGQDEPINWFSFSPLTEAQVVEACVVLTDKTSTETPFTKYLTLVNLTDWERSIPEAFFSMAINEIAYSRPDDLDRPKPLHLDADDLERVIEPLYSDLEEIKKIADGYLSVYVAERLVPSTPSLQKGGNSSNFPVQLLVQAALTPKSDSELMLGALEEKTTKFYEKLTRATIAVPEDYSFEKRQERAVMPGDRNACSVM